MTHLIVKSDWSNRLDTDMKVLNFFGDLRVYAAKGKTPTKEEVDKLLKLS